MFTPTLVKSLPSVRGVRAGQHHTLAATADGGLLSFGRPTYGRLGQGSADVAADSACPEPMRVDGLEGVEVAGAAAGLAVSGCFDASGDGWLWGFGTSNQLGKGDDDEGVTLGSCCCGRCMRGHARTRTCPAWCIMVCVMLQGGGGGGKGSLAGLM